MESKTITLGDVANITKLAGFEFTKHIEYINDGEIIALRALNLRNGKLDLTDIKRIDRKVSEYLIRSKLFVGDILLTYTGNGYGDCAIIDENDKYHLAPNICKITPNTDIINPYYLYCYIRSSNFYSIMSNNMTGSSQPTIPMKSIRVLGIPQLPSLETQKQTAKILSSIDDKIELNNKINDNLEKQAQAIFKSWFVDFEPFGGVMPSDWEKSDIYSISNIVYGAPFKSKLFNAEGDGLPIIRIRDLKKEYSEVYTPEAHPKGRLIELGDIVVGMDGEFRPYIWGGDKAWLNQRVCIFENKRSSGSFFLYFTIKPLLNHVEETEIATTVIHIGKSDFDAFEIHLPTNDVLDKFDLLSEPIYQSIVNNKIENKRLAMLRDTLLPRLMSGEIDVSQVELPPSPKGDTPLKEGGKLPK